MNAAVGLMDGSALMVIGVSAWYPDSKVQFKTLIYFELEQTSN